MRRPPSVVGAGAGGIVSWRFADMMRRSYARPTLAAGGVVEPPQSDPLRDGASLTSTAIAVTTLLPAGSREMRDRTRLPSGVPMSLPTRWLTVLIGFLLTLPARGEVVDVRPDTTDAEFGGNRYRVCRPAKGAAGWTWHQARDACRAMGGRLVVIESAEEQAFLGSLAAPPKGARADVGMWIGLSDEAREGRWAWVDGSPLGFAAWSARGREPNNTEGVEHAAEMAWHHNLGGAWNDNKAGQRQGFVCEWPGSAARGEPIADAVFWVADDFVTEVRHNGQPVPPAQRRLENEVFGATVDAPGPRPARAGRSSSTDAFS